MVAETFAIEECIGSNDMTQNNFDENEVHCRGTWRCPHTITTKDEKLIKLIRT